MITSKANAEARCPACLKSLDAATDPAGMHTPQPGDFSICVYCSVPLVFQTDMTVRAARDDDLDSLPDETRQQMEAYRRAVHATLVKRT